jgi:hypothetical protein
VAHNVAETARHPLLRALGGVLGIIEAVVPPALFVGVYAFTSKAPGLPWAAMIVSALSAVLFIAIRLIRHEGATQAIAGLITVAASVFLVLVSGKAENNFLPGLITNIAYAAAFLISILVGWPLVGVAVGLLSKRGHGWRSKPREKRMFSWLSVMWLAMFLARVVVEVPLYFAHNVEALGIVKLVMGLPLYAPVVLLTWLFVRGMFIEEDNTSDQKNVS